MGARGGEARGEPGHGVAIGGGLLHAAVKVGDGGDAGAVAEPRGSERSVPWKDVVRREVVGPCHARGHPLHRHDGRPRHGGRLPAGAVGEDPRRRKVTVEFLST